MWVINHLHGLASEADSSASVEIDKGYKFLKESPEAYFLNFTVLQLYFQTPHRFLKTVFLDYLSLV